MLSCGSLRANTAETSYRQSANIVVQLGRGVGGDFIVHIWACSGTGPNNVFIRCRLRCDRFALLYSWHVICLNYPPIFVQIMIEQVILFGICLFAFSFPYYSFCFSSSRRVVRCNSECMEQITNVHGIMLNFILRYEYIT